MSPQASSYYPSIDINAATLPDVLRRRSVEQADEVAFIFLADGEQDERPLTYGELDRQARVIAASLLRAGDSGSRALLVYDSGLDYIAALYGCFYAGVVAVPVYPPDPFRADRTLPRLRSIVNDAGATWLLATEETLDWARPLFRNVQGLSSSLATDALLRATTESASAHELPTLEPSQTALLQYTSGSTGEPRGVTITHANLVANLRSIHAALEREGNVVVLWLPAYHDMGLIGGMFQPVYSGRRLVFMSPLSFMQRPARWLEAISHYRGTITAAPNFAYELCIRKVSPQERESLDLSSLIAALNGAEMVRPETLHHFAETFAQCGFRREAFYPCYGLAEATLMVTGAALDELPVVRSFSAAALEENRAVAAEGESGTRRLVGCGGPALGQDVRVVDPETRQPLQAGQVGEVWVAGESIGQGYWNRPEESEATFHAHLAGSDEGPFLRTGDFGFFDQGELFIAGRRKELIIVRGRNHYPHDIEETVWQSHPLLKADGGAAFSIEVAGEERLAVVQEVMRPRKADPAKLIELIRAQLTEIHGVAPVAVALIPAGTLPKTSSGKKQRRACRDQFLSGSLPLVGGWRDERVFAGGASAETAIVEPRTETEKKLAKIWGDVLGMEARDINANFFDLGGQSLLAGQLAARIQEAFSVDLPLRTLFAKPTIASLADWLDRPHERHSGDGLPPITRAHRSQPLPLSSFQEQLWFLEQLEAEPRYSLAASIRLRGNLDATALDRSLAAILARHEVLRTTFPTIDGKPRQVIADRQSLPLQIADVPAELPALGHKFDLSNGPLLSATLQRISELDHRLVIVAHHMICDGWSLAILLRELAALYTGFVERASPLAPRAALDGIAWHYADFAVWQQNCLATPQLAHELEYWKRQLAGVEPIELVTDYQRSAEATFRGESVTWTIDKALADSLVKLAHEEGATLYMVLLAVFQTLLARYSRQQDICVGSPVSYRPRCEFENAIGYFVNILALRADLSGEPTFRQLLGRVRESVLDALANVNASLRAVVDAVAPRREAGRTPLFNVMFVFENLPWHAIQAAEVTLGEIEIDHTRIGSYDLGLVIEEHADGLKASLVYNAELFDRATIERMSAAFGLLLRGIVSEADRSVMRLPLAEPATKQADKETRRQGDKERSSGSDSSFPLSPCLLVSPSRKQQCNVAIVDGERQLTYGEFENSSNRLAHYLRALGVTVEVPVAIYLDRSIELIVAMLAVLKAGGTYVPFDPNEAPGRLAAMLADTRPRAIITHSRMAQCLPPHEAEEICVDREANEIARHPDSPPVSTASADNLAYIIYTSGSSGRPKGVEVSRAALDNLVRAMADVYELSADDRVLQLISPAFDVSAEEIFPTLLCGATLVLGPTTAELTGRAILDVFRRERVTVAHVPPQLWQQCLHEWQPEDEALFEHLRVLVHGGEASSSDAINRWLRLSRGRVRVLHEFGLTETTVTNLVYELPQELDSWPARRKLPVGRPVAGADVYVLDEHQQPVPIGAPGELYLGGPGLARAYHRLPEATKERFVDVAGLATAPRSVRLCRTGDLARWLPDGNLEFLGRIDTQIKLRGLRIEPGEIERVLAEHPAIREAAVIVREDVRGVKRLVAYLVPANGEIADVSELRRWLREKLPDSMSPAVFMPIPRLPLNRSHKLDRDALPPPPEDKSKRLPTAPRSDLERILVEVWQAVLKVERVGIHDNFFELGGDSILTIQVVARAREAGLRFTPRQLFEQQTIAELAAVEGAEETTAEQGRVTGDVPLTPVQHWFLSEGAVDPHYFNQAVLLRVDRLLDPRHLPAVLTRLIEQHDALRLRFALDASGWRQWHADESDWPLERFDLSTLPAAERPAALTGKATSLQAGLDLESGPLARAAWFEVGAEEARLLLVVHHLAIDAVSWRALLEDLATVWRQLQEGKQPALPPKSTSFKQWAERLTTYAQSPELEDGFAFWRALADKQPAALPCDSRGENVQGDAEVVSGTWSAAEAGQLLNEAGAAYRMQTNEILLAALGQSLSEWAGGQVLIDVEGHGRVPLFDDVDLSRTIGWFTAWFPHLSAAADLPPSALLRQTKEAFRGVPNQGLGFGVLRYLSPRPDIRARMAGLPPAQASFNYLGRMDEYLSSTSLTVVDESVGPWRSPRAQRRHLIEINAAVFNGCLRVDWTFCRNLHHRETIEGLAADFRDRLAALIGHCLSPEAGAFTPSDFPLARLNDSELEKLANLLDD